MLLCKYNVIKVSSVTPEVKKFKEYLTATLGTEVQVRRWEGESKLPLYLREAFDFHQAGLLGKIFVLAVDRATKEPSPASVHKQILQMQEKSQLDVIYMRPGITSYNRQRLIGYHVPFVVPGNQMYLPMLAIDLRERFKAAREGKSVLSPVTQALVLAVLNDAHRGPITPSTMAEMLRYTRMSVGRAFRELEHLGVAQIETIGKGRELRFGKQGKQLWDTLLPYLRTPVRKQFYATVPPGHMIRVKAGITALAQYSSIAEPTVPACALMSEEWERLLRRKAREVSGPESGAIQIEIWAYDPELFQKGEVADRLSLYLSLKESTDERIQIALDEMMGDMPW
jgi:hypothetical protein